MILDLFAGPGGWEEGLRHLGRGDTLGVEWDRAACDTALAAGHARLWADVASLPVEAITDAYGPVQGLIASPPCQAWSMAGQRKGEKDRAGCHALADRMAAGDDSTTWTAWEDERSPLVCQPVRWVRDLRPEWVALEEVPAVASLWRHFARILCGWGYSVWTGGLNAADYGVPQTRERRILLAHRTLGVQPPEPTHAQNPCGADLFGGELRPWVSMAEALGWGMTERPYFTLATAGGKRGGADEQVGGSGARKALYREREEGRWFVSAGVTGEGHPKDPGTQPADTLTGKGTAYWLRMGNTTKATVRHVSEPAPTVLFGNRANAVDWWQERPATTVMGDARIGRPGHKDRDAGESAFDQGSVRVSVEEAGVLQSFRPDYPWRGSRTKQFQQVGNAIPPLLAAHVLAALGVGELDLERAA